MANKKHTVFIISPVRIIIWYSKINEYISHYCHKNNFIISIISIYKTKVIKKLNFADNIV